MLDRLTGLMQFTSVSYLTFLALAVVVYFLLPAVWARALWLLGLSVTFYLLLSPRWFWVLAVVTIFTYGMGRAVGTLRGSRSGEQASGSERLLLAIGICTVVGTLVFFKYIGFVAETGNAIFEAASVGLSLPVIRLLLPIGISFWTFQSIAYLVDVYKGVTEPERNLLYFALAMVFFPVVTAGPITRVQVLVEQLSVRHRFDYGGMQSGLLLIGRGFFKKLMVADALAVFVNTVFGHPYRYSPTVNGLIFSVAAVFFSIQLYCDFSGYTDVVRGSARLFGVELPLNFRAPYFAREVRDFWRRWHMSLMDWLRDYVYIPLGGSRRGKLRRDLNVMTVFLVSGLWHGAGLTYLVWGGLNGTYMIAGEKLQPSRDKVVDWLRIDRNSVGHRIVQTLITFGLITFAWVFFRAETLREALYIVSSMFFPTLWIFTDGTMVHQGLTYPQLTVALLSAVAVWVLDWMSLRMDLLVGFNRQPLLIRWAVYYGLILVVVVFGQYGGGYNAADFVYFRF